MGPGGAEKPKGPRPNAESLNCMDSQEIWRVMSPTVGNLRARAVQLTFLTVQHLPQLVGQLPRVEGLWENGCFFNGTQIAKIGLGITTRRKDEGEMRIDGGYLRGRFWAIENRHDDIEEYQVD